VRAPSPKQLQSVQNLSCSSTYFLLYFAGDSVWFGSSHCAEYMQATFLLVGSWNMTCSILHFIHKTYKFCHLDKLLEIHVWELGGASIFVGTTL
jgi:hypothetical protein